jgi:hypothetical protein
MASNRRQLRKAILKEMFINECACQDQEMLRAAHGVKFHNNGPEEESGMIRSNLYTMSKQAQEMHDMIAMNDDLDEWVQEKIAVASSMIDSVYDYLGYEYKAMRGDVPSHDSYNPDIIVDDQMHDDRISSFETGYDFAVDDMEDEDYYDDEEYDEYIINEEDERELDDLDADEVMHDPWQPMHQSTGIMFFEDQMNESRRRRRN